MSRYLRPHEPEARQCLENPIFVRSTKPARRRNRQGYRELPTLWRGTRKIREVRAHKIMRLCLPVLIRLPDVSLRPYLFTSLRPYNPSPDVVPLAWVRRLWSWSPSGTNTQLYVRRLPYELESDVRRRPRAKQALPSLTLRFPFVRASGIRWIKQMASSMPHVNFGLSDGPWMWAVGMDSHNLQGSKTVINNRNVYENGATHFQAVNGGHIVHGGDNMKVYLNGHSANGGTKDRDGKKDDLRRGARAYNCRTDLFSLLNPIPDASHTRNRKLAGPDSACFPGTRKKVLKMIRSWANSSLFLGNPHIMWVYGYAGCGKSAIAQAIAEHFSGQKRLAASFFFFRGSGDRSTAARFTTSVAHQVAEAIPATAPFIEAAIIANRALITGALVLHVQFEKLVFQPINNVKWDRMASTLRHGPYLIILDGLDECDDRDQVAAFIENLISFFDKKPRIPLRFLITSRVENHIYERLHSSKQVQLLNLVDFTSDDDISAALDVAIANAKRNRVVACEESWPSLEDKAKLVKHIGGSYIFMTTIVKFLFDPAINDGRMPMERLPLVLSLRPDFDGLYTAILSASQHLPYFHQVISTIALVQEAVSVVQIAGILGIKTASVVNVLVNLHAIMQVPGDDRTAVTLWHTSLRDFLCTRKRSGVLYASPAHHRQIAYQCISSAASPTGSPGSLPVDYSRRFAMEHWLAFVQLIGDDTGTFGAEISSFIDHLKVHFPESYNTILHIYLQLQAGQPSGNTLLDVVLRCQSWEDLELILKPNIDVRLVRPTVQDELARSTLEEACLSKNWKLMRNLISKTPHTVNIRFQDVARKNLVTALHVACHHKEFDMIYFLLENGADPNVSDLSANFYYGTPLSFASHKGDIKLVTRLFECGADPNLQGGVYGTVLQAACGSGNLEVVNLLLKHGADPNLTGGVFGSALHACAFSDHVDCVQALLEHKADPNVRDKDGGTPLHQECYWGRTRVAELLLDFGADATIRNNYGETAPQRAIEKRREDSEIVQMLRRRGVATHSHVGLNLAPILIGRTALTEEASGRRMILHLVLSFNASNAPISKLLPSTSVITSRISVVLALLDDSPLALSSLYVAPAPTSQCRVPSLFHRGHRRALTLNDAPYNHQQLLILLPSIAPCP
ncbi:hypothetical protein NMY22_g7548 [Coprinellus aureogranulatus]|nr:hypothetical protein NMY22_g7548 [Coprinellus aureogranulatus]